MMQRMIQSITGSLQDLLAAESQDPAIQDTESKEPRSRTAERWRDIETQLGIERWPAEEKDLPRIVWWLKKERGVAVEEILPKDVAALFERDEVVDMISSMLQVLPSEKPADHVNLLCEGIPLQVAEEDASRLVELLGSKGVEVTLAFPENAEEQPGVGGQKRVKGE